DTPVEPLPIESPSLEPRRRKPPPVEPAITEPFDEVASAEPPVGSGSAPPAQRDDKPPEPAPIAPEPRSRRRRATIASGMLAVLAVAAVVFVVARPSPVAQPVTAVDTADATASEPGADGERDGHRATTRAVIASADRVAAEPAAAEPAAAEPAAAEPAATEPAAAQLKPRPRRSPDRPKESRIASSSRVTDRDNATPDDRSERKFTGFVRIGGPGALRAQIRISGLRRGYAPVLLELVGGKHTVELIAEDGRRIARKTIHIEPHHTKSRPVEWRVPAAD
ncbi:MAG: hypothetical protein AAGC55_22080, partial [Myxococcota bacterium]